MVKNIKQKLSLGGFFAHTMSNFVTKVKVCDEKSQILRLKSQILW